MIAKVWVLAALAAAFVGVQAVPQAVGRRASELRCRMACLLGVTSTTKDARLPPLFAASIHPPLNQTNNERGSEDDMKALVQGGIGTIV
ncbi:hypothetical protein BC835DRAFT_1410416 [Cytidiella melzeri]|nr:hypothetical protein BC835DRAFT_1410416 [Cytidiella melzeri]